jgi:Bacterial SH3 domain
MTLRALLGLALFALSCAAGAQEQAFTNRSTELREQGAAESRVLATLPENTPVKVLARGGGWTRVDAGGTAGWVRVFHLRFPVVAVTSSSSGNALTGLGSALGFGKSRSQEANTATLGVRGLDKEQVQSASPDPEALRRLHSFRVDQATAERFARDGKLNAVSIDYERGRR